MVDKPPPDNASLEKAVDISYCLYSLGKITDKPAEFRLFLDTTVYYSWKLPRKRTDGLAEG